MYGKGNHRGVPPGLFAKIERVLRLDVAAKRDDMGLPGLRLYPLKGDRTGYWAVSVSADWRVVFRFDGEGAEDVDLTDDQLETRAVPMKDPPHPGLSVRHDCLEPLGLTVTEAARRLGVSRKQLSELVNGRSGISPEIAIRLDKAFGGGAETWYRLQSAYDLAQAMKNAGRIRVERIPTPG